MYEKSEPNWGSKGLRELLVLNQGISWNRVLLLRHSDFRPGVLALATRDNVRDV